MKKYLKILLPICLAAATPATMAAEKSFSLSGNVALTSDYIFRGVSQSNEKMAIQGGFDYEHKKGFYGGIWSSNVSSALYNGSGIETDLYFGFKGKFSSNFEYDVGFIEYSYPGSSPSTDYDEVYFGVSYKSFSAKYYAGVDAGNDELGDYFEVGYDLGLPKGFSVGFHVGDWDAVTATGDYTDYKISLARKFGGFDFELSYTDTDIKNDKLAEDRFVLTISKSL
ncbi:MAG TPA: hypothetical protein ENG78_06455 [Acidiferrobacteraceae bacterium]|nr:hypothetical protein [Acidiferrobacteraceae bacterium]HEX20442.1 hypothetical protein [Acidiferrobacteraceae bacterium]